MSEEIATTTAAETTAEPVDTTTNKSPVENKTDEVVATNEGEKEGDSALAGLKTAKEGANDKAGEKVDVSQFTDEDYLKAVGENGKDGEELVSSFTKEFRDAGVSPEVANKIVKAYIQKGQEAQEEYRKQMAEDSAKAFEGYTDLDKQAVGDAISRYVPKESRLHAALMHSPLGNDRDMLAILRQLGKSLARDKVTGAGATGANGANVPLTAQLGF